MPSRQMTPIKPIHGTVVHATSLSTPQRTACGLSCDGWMVAPVAEPVAARVSCEKCQRAMLLPVSKDAKPAKKRRRR